MKTLGLWEAAAILGALAGIEQAFKRLIYCRNFQAGAFLLTILLTH